LRKFAYFAPQSLSEALALFQEHGEGGRALAGDAGDTGTHPEGPA